ncbi:MAG: YggT family protein [Treponema sp.]|nr:YggT family protein [Treponema sp.]
MMQFIFRILAAAAGIYSLLIFIRIIISWFGGFISGKPVEILNKITDPYLDWFRKKLNIRVGFLDFSVVVAIVSLSLIQNILLTLSVSERMTIGFLLAEVILSLWRIISFILTFLIVVIVLRAIAYLTNRNIYSPFWSIVDSISQPIMYRMNRLFFGDKIGGYLKGILFSLILLAVILFAGRFIIKLIAGLLYSFPL